MQSDQWGSAHKQREVSHMDGHGHELIDHMHGPFIYMGMDMWGWPIHIYKSRSLSIT